MSPKSTHIPTDLIAKYLAGESTADEKQLVEEWKAENPELFKQFSIVWADTGTLKNETPLLAFDTDKAWRKVAPKIHQEDKKTDPWKAYLRIAAVLIAGFALGFWIINSAKEPSVSLAQFSTTTGTAQAILIDSTVITLNAGSRIRIDEDFATDYRKVTLEGEAYFQVKADPENPFEIAAGKATIRVLGTAFNVKIADTGDVEVRVDEGVVTLSNGTEEISLKAKESAKFDAQSTKLISLDQDMSGINTFWKTKRLTFAGQNLEEIVSILQLAYGTQIKLSTPQLNTCKLHVTFDQSSIDEVMEIIALTLELQTEKQGNSYLLTGKGCEN